MGYAFILFRIIMIKIICINLDFILQKFHIYNLYRNNTIKFFRRFTILFMIIVYTYHKYLNADIFLILYKEINVRNYQVKVGCICYNKLLR